VEIFKQNGSSVGSLFHYIKWIFSFAVCRPTNAGTGAWGPQPPPPPLGGLGWRSANGSGVENHNWRMSGCGGEPEMNWRAGSGGPEVSWHASIATQADIPQHIFKDN
jgi:hypothetical protein